MRRRSFLVNAAGLAVAVAGGFWLKDNVLWRRPKIAFGTGGQWTDLHAASLPLPVVRANLKGRDVLALIDSGAQYSVLDRALAEELMASGDVSRAFDMPMLAYGVGGQAQVGRGTTLDVGLADVTISNLRAAILDLGPLASQDGLGVGLIIGRDVLFETVLELDMGNRRMRLADPDVWHASADLRPTIVHRDGDALGVELTVEGAVVRAILDTGASNLLSLSESTAQEAGLLDGRKEEAGQSLVLGGVSRARWLTVQTLTLGDTMRRNVRVAVYPDSHLPNYPDALLGIGAFRDRKLALDMAKGALFVEGQLDLTIGGDA